MKCWKCDQESKYKCPGCGKMSCGLECSRLHKNVFNCSGKRDNTKYVRRSEYNVNNLQSDYEFLESVGRVTDNAIRNQIPMRKQRPNKIIKVAHQKSINLRLMPDVMSRHKLNRTKIDKNTIQWTVEWKFMDVKEIAYDHL